MLTTMLVSYVKAVVAAFNQEKALVGAFSVIVQLRRLIVYSTREECTGNYCETAERQPVSGVSEM